MPKLKELKGAIKTRHKTRVKKIKKIISMGRRDLVKSLKRKKK